MNPEEYAEVLESIDDSQHEAFAIWYEYDSSWTADEAADAFQDQYCGEWGSLEAYAESLVDEGIFGDIPKALENYIDYEAIANDLQCSGEYWEENGHVFRSF